MGIQKTEVEVTSTVPADKLFKGLLVDIDTVLPKAFPPAMKGVEILEGDGGVGTVKLITLGEASQYNTMKQRIDAIDTEKLTYTYSIIGGDILLDMIESIENQFVVTPTEGGCTVKNITIYHTKGDAVIPEENVKDATEKSGLIFKAVEAYLLAN